MSEWVPPEQVRLMSDAAVASDPGRVQIDPQRLRRQAPGLFGAGSVLPARALARKVLVEHLHHGDSNPAVVLSVDPLLVAAYSADFDAVVVLRFHPATLDLPLQVGSRLLSVNTYFDGGSLAPDIVRGPLASGAWSNYHPVVADFICTDLRHIARHKAAIGEPVWRRTWDLGHQHLAQRPSQVRDGAPHRSKRPAR